MKKLLTLAAATAIGFSTVSAQALPERAPMAGMNRVPEFGLRHNRQSSAGPLLQAPVGTLLETIDFAGKPDKSPTTPQRRMTAAGTELYGYLAGSTDQDQAVGLYEMTSTADNRLLWADQIYQASGSASMQSGWYADGRVRGFTPLIYSGYIIALNYVEFDFATGQVLTNNSLDLTDPSIMSTACYNEADGYVYGYGTHGANTDAIFCMLKAPLDNPADMTVVKSLGGSPWGSLLSMTYCPADRKMYGVNTDGNLVTVDTKGNQTVVYKAAPSDMGMYYSGIAYSKSEDLFYWEILRDNGTTSLYTLDAANKKTTLVCNYTKSEQYTYMFTINEKENPKAPVKAEYTGNTFASGATSGSVTFRLPSKLVDGTAISGSLDWEFLLDGSVYKTGTSSAGQNVTVEFSNLATGTHSFAIASKAGGVQSAMSAKLIYVGNDIPREPRNVTLDHLGNVKWDAVTVGVNEGYLDLSDLTYIIRMNGSQIATTKTTNYQLVIDADAPLASIEVEVSAMCRGLESKPAKSNPVVFGKPMTPNVVLTPTESESLLFTTFDGNGDGVNWVFTTGFSRPCFYSGYSTLGNADDWLILPPVTLDDPSTYYMFSSDIAGRSSYCPDEYFEVRLGSAPTPEAMTEVIIPRTKVDAFLDEFKTYSAQFGIKEAGTYYIGVRCVSLEQQYAILASQFKISKTDVTSESPAAVTDLTATAGAKGALNATVTFKLPLTDMKGNTLNPTATLTATVKADEVKTVSGAPGSQQSVTVRTVSGENTIVVTPAMGDKTGTSAEVKVMCGVDAPGPIENLRVAIGEDMMHADFKWDAPTIGDNGGYIDPEACRYNIHLFDNASNSWDVIATGVKGTAYTLSLAKGTAQEYRRLGVEVINSAGYAEKIRTIYFVLGTPYSLPMSENFDSESLEIEPFVTYMPTSAYTASWTYVDSKYVLSGADGSMLVAQAKTAPAKGRLGIPAFSTVGATDAKATFRLWLGSGSPNISILYQTAWMSEPAMLRNIARTGSWSNAAVELPSELLGLGWVKLYVDCELSSTSEVLYLDELSVTGTVANETIGLPDATGTVTGGEGVATFVNLEGVTADIYSVDGRHIAKFVPASDRDELRIACGVYIVRFGGRSAKIAVH